MTAFTKEQYIEEMVATRRKIHQMPEEGWTEFETSWRQVPRRAAVLH